MLHMPRGAWDWYGSTKAGLSDTVRAPSESLQNAGWILISASVWYGELLFDSPDVLSPVPLTHHLISSPSVIVVFQVCFYMRVFLLGAVQVLLVRHPVTLPLQWGTRWPLLCLAQLWVFSTPQSWHDKDKRTCRLLCVFIPLQRKCPLFAFIRHQY